MRSKLAALNVRFIKKENMKINNKITREDALKKIGNYGKFAALTSLSTFLILNPKKAQASSPSSPGTGF